MPPDPYASQVALSLLLALVALAVALMHPSLWWIGLVIAVVAMLISPSPP